IDPERGIVTATVTVGKDDEPAEVAVGAGGVWVANRQAATVARIVPARAAVDPTLELGSAPQGLAIVDGALWVSVTGGGSAHRGGTLRLVDAAAAVSSELDPAYSYGEPTLNEATRDGLMTLRRSAGTSYGVPIPNLAVAHPEVSDGGRTYTFTIRRGIRFSDGRPLRPSDLAYSLNRAARTGQGGQILDTVARARADDAAGTVTLHLEQPDPEILYKLTTGFGSVVPQGSGKPPVKRPLPATGPYRVTKFTSGRGYRLERNPYFKVWSAAARPDGYPDAITKVVTDTEAGVRRVARGAADVLTLPHLAQMTKRLPELRRRYGERLHTFAPAGTQWFFMNVDMPPFDDVRARRAVLLGLDRRAILRRQGGESGARLTCRIIPPTLAGHDESPCPYPEQPDLARARRLVRASGTRGMRVTVLTGDPAFTANSEVLVKTLRRIGHRPTDRNQPIGAYFEGILNRPRHDGHIGTMGWYADYPSPSNFILPLFRCGRPPANSNVGHYCDRQLDALARRAQRLQISRPEEANRLWAAADRRIVERAAAAPLTNGVNHFLVSERVANFQAGTFSPRFDQLWVR
ncbi:MAG: ABC transporter substrate-binding protein, partial [Solirubrobacteraceae bacterium]